MFTYIWASCLENVHKKIYFYKFAFTLKRYNIMWEYLAQKMKADVNILVLN